MAENLPIQPGNWQSLNDHLGSIETGGSIAALSNANSHPAPNSNYGSPPIASQLDPTTLVAPNGTQLTSIHTYTGIDDEVVEPSVYYNPNQWNGFEFWMAAGPYSNQNAAFENPSIWCSHDGQTWQIPPGATNPVQGPPATGNYDDPHLFEYLGTLYLVWNWSPGGLPDKVLMSTSTDGVTWTTAQTIVTGVNAAKHELVSPHLAFYAGNWYLWALNLVAGAPNAVYLRKAATIAGLATATATACTLTTVSGLDFWEFEVKRVGSQWWMLQNLVTTGGSAAGGRLYFHTSPDGLTWTIAPQPVLQANLGSGNPWDSNFIYKASFVPLLDGRVGIWYSAGNGTPLWFVGYTTAATPSQTPLQGASAAWYAPPCPVTTAALSNGVVNYIPVYFDRATTLATIGLEVTGAGTVGALVRLGIYADSGSGLPVRLLYDAGTIDGTSATVQTLTAGSTVVGPGVVWFAAVSQGTPATPATVRSANGPTGVPIGTTSTLASQNALAGFKWAIGLNSGGLEAIVTTSSLTAANTPARVIYRPA